ncbi:MAG TPA: DUF397 domain-containing protein [Micromonosporaceae bacterium]|jgi:hypothetical protein
MHTYNGMSAADLRGLSWRRARRSSPSGNCVELAQLPGGAGVAMRNSRDPMGPALIYTVDEIAAFLDDARAGELDFLIR